MCPSFQSVGISSSSHIFLNRGSSMSAVISASALIASAGIPSGPVALPFFKFLAIDWIMKGTTEGARNGIPWTLWNQLEDQDFADDLALLAHSHQQIQDKTSKLKSISNQVGLEIHPKKAQIMKMNTPNADPVTLGGNRI